MADRLERITELLMLLLDSSQALTFEEIVDRTELYRNVSEASRKAFERDKSGLRGLGVVITTATEEGDRGATRYRVRPQDYFLPDLDLSEGERLSLHLAAAAVRLDDAWDDRAVLKLGGSQSSLAPAVATVPTLEALPDLHAAIGDRAEVSFEYRDRRRTLWPYGLFYREGHWYLAAADDGATKTFRIDRIRGAVSVGEAGSFEAPDDFDINQAMPRDPLLIGEELDLTAEVAIDASLAGRVARLRGSDVRERRPDGSIVVEVRVRNRDAFRSWVLGLRDHAVVLGPPELRSDMVDWLQTVAKGADG